MGRTGEFLDPNHLGVTKADGGKQVISFKNAIIAAGSEAVKLPFLQTPELKGDPRIVTSTGALELRQIPKRMLVIGGGIIGLEMGTVYSTLGARLDVVEMLDGLMQGADRDLVKVWQKMNAPRFDNVMLKTKTVGAEATKKGILVKFEGVDGNTGAPKEPQLYDMVLQAVGRVPNGRRIGADKAGVAVNERGLIPWNQISPTCRTFRHGDIVCQPSWRTRPRTRPVAQKVGRRSHRLSTPADPELAYTDTRCVGVFTRRCRAICQKAEVLSLEARPRLANTAIRVHQLRFTSHPPHRGLRHRGTHAGDMTGDCAA